MAMTVIAMGDHAIPFHDLHSFINAVQSRLPHPLRWWDWLDTQWQLIQDDYYENMTVEWESTGVVQFRYDVRDIYINLYCAKRAFYVASDVNWRAFLNDISGIQIVLRRIFYLINRSLHGSRMIYVADSGGCLSTGFDTWIGGDIVLERIEEALLEECGKPCNSIEEILSAESAVCLYDGYFIDTFQDISSEYGAIDSPHS